MKRYLNILFATTIALTLTVITVGFIAAQTPTANPKIRAIHLAPFASGSAAVDIVITNTNTITLTNVAFKDGIDGDYVEVDPILTEAGVYTPANTLVFTGSFTPQPGNSYSVVAAGGANGYPLQFLVVTDTTTAPAAGKAKVNITHAAPFFPGGAAVDIVNTDTNTNVLTDVTFGQTSGYLELDAGTYNLAIVSETPAVTIPVPVTLEAGSILSVFAVGGANGQDADIVINTIATGTANIRPVHLAPFSETDTTVDIEVNNTANALRLENIQYGDGITSSYASISALTTTVGVFTPTGTTALFDNTFNYQANTDYTVVAIGGANGYALELLVLTDTTTTPMSGTGKLRVTHAAPFTSTNNATVDILVEADDSPVLEDVPFGATSGYLELPATTYDLKIVAADTTTPTVIDVPEFTLNDGGVLSVFAVGGANGQDAGIEVIQIEAGQSDQALIYLPLIQKN